MFLTEDEITILTGRKMKGRQIEALRNMGVPFRINATGHVLSSRALSSRDARKKLRRTSMDAARVEGWLIWGESRPET